MNKTWNVTITLRVTEPTEADALCTAKEYMEMAGICISWDSVCKDAEVERAEEVRTEEGDRMIPTWKVGDRVKVIGQDIWGPIVEVNPYAVVIDDEDSEWEYPESRLEYRHDEVHRA